MSPATALQESEEKLESRTLQHLQGHWQLVLAQQESTVEECRLQSHLAASWTGF